VHIIVSTTLACLFVFLAGFNVWNMLARSGASAASQRWTQVHRVAGYAFIALFVIFFAFMVPRIKGEQDELSPRMALHMALALLLAPLLFVKVTVARYQKAARGLLMALGIAIFGSAFTLVALNLITHYLRNASAGRLPLGLAVALVVGTLMAAAPLLSKSSRPKPAAAPATVPLSQSSQAAPPTGQALNLVLSRIEPQTHDAKTLRFLLPRGQHLAACPGQFLTFEWIVDGRPVTRSYSICSSPLQTGYVEITPKRVEGGCVSVFLNDRAQEGLIVRARGPYGRFCLDEDKHERTVLIAGGSGITPMIAMLRYMDDLCSAANVRLLYCVRTERDVFFKADLAELRDRLRNFRYALILSRPSSEWHGWEGHLRREILEREVEKPLEATFFLCGPSPFMEVGRALLNEMGVRPAQIMQESFGGVASGAREPAPGTGLFTVRCERSTAAYKVSPTETLLESAERNGVLIPSGCRRGDCGTCATRLLSGSVKMENEAALDADLRSQGFILPCVARVLGDITLDA